MKLGEQDQKLQTYTDGVFREEIMKSKRIHFPLKCFTKAEGRKLGCKSVTQ